MSSEIDWEFGLGLPKEALEDDIKGMDELSLSSKLIKVILGFLMVRQTMKYNDLRLMILWTILQRLYIY